MALPAIDAERWRLVEQKLAEYGTDIARLWRQLQNVQTGGYGNSGALTPTDLAALTAAGSGGTADVVRVYTLAVRGNATAGTISWSATDGATTATGDFAFDDDDSDITSDLSSFDSGVQAEGGTLKYNAIKIKFTDSTQRLRITSTSLTRDTYGVTPVVELSYCDEPEAWWD